MGASTPRKENSADSGSVVLTAIAGASRVSITCLPTDDFASHVPFLTTRATRALKGKFHTRWSAIESAIEISPDGGRVILTSRPSFFRKGHGKLPDGRGNAGASTVVKVIPSPLTLHLRTALIPLRVNSARNHL